MSKTCQYCQKIYINCDMKNTCDSCRKYMKKYGTIDLKIKCDFCSNEFKRNVNNQKFCSKQCYRKQHTINTRNQYRKDNNISLDLPVKPKKPNGFGHKDPHGYKYITKMRHPNATKSGRIYEHTFVMSEFLGRPLIKNESVHHKNGIRDDNRIDNLELWHKGQPAGQRIEEKIKWAKEFLTKYGVKFID